MASVCESVLVWDVNLSGLYVYNIIVTFINMTTRNPEYDCDNYRDPLCVVPLSLFMERNGLSYEIPVWCLDGM